MIVEGRAPSKVVRHTFDETKDVVVLLKLAIDSCIKSVSDHLTRCPAFHNHSNPNQTVEYTSVNYSTLPHSP